MLQVGQQAHIRVRKRRPRAGFEMLDRLGRVPAADNVEPFLHVALVPELSRCTRARSLEERIRSNSSNSPALAIATSSSGIWYVSNRICGSAP